MPNVQIVTDSGIFLPEAVREELEITVIPQTVRIGKQTQTEPVEFAGNFAVDELFQMQQQAQAMGMPHEADVHAADVNQILDVYQRLGRRSHEIVSIHSSSHLSPTWQQARNAAEMLRGRYTIRVVDSLSTSLGLGILVTRAARAAADGADINEIARIINGTIPHLYLTTFTESLSFLERSTPIGASQSILGTMLGLKAMIVMEQGRLVPLEKVQTREEVVDKLYEFVAEFATAEQVGIVQHGYAAQQDELVTRIEESMPDVQVWRLPYAPSLAAYLGPNTIGVVVYESERY